MGKCATCGVHSRRFRYNGFDEVGDPALLEITDHEILASYWDTWVEKMTKKIGPEIAIFDYRNRIACIEDWLTVHWAWEIT